MRSCSASTYTLRSVMRPGRAEDPAAPRLRLHQRGSQGYPSPPQPTPHPHSLDTGARAVTSVLRIQPNSGSCRDRATLPAQRRCRPRRPLQAIAKTRIVPPRADSSLNPSVSTSRVTWTKSPNRTEDMMRPPRRPLSSSLALLPPWPLPGSAGEGHAGTSDPPRPQRTLWRQTTPSEAAAAADAPAETPARGPRRRVPGRHRGGKSIAPAARPL